MKLNVAHVRRSLLTRTATTLDEGFPLMREIGWTAITQRARRSVQLLPADAVLAGLSMGVGVVGTLLPVRGQTAGVLMLHALADIPDIARPGLPVQVHVGDPDVEFAPPAAVAMWQDSARRMGAQAQVPPVLAPVTSTQTPACRTTTSARQN